MAHPQPISYISSAEYLAGENDGYIRHEYVDGQIYAMAGASSRHNQITMNIAFHLRGNSRGSSCKVFVSDMKFYVAEHSVFYYPDIMLSCNKDDENDYYIERPCLVAEVLSTATEAIDRREKLKIYQSIKEVRYILLVAQDKQQVEYWVRGADDGWQVAQLEEDDELKVECLPVTLSLSLDDIYEDIVQNPYTESLC